MVAVLGRAAAATTEPVFQLAPAAGTGHPFPAMLAAESAFGVSAPDIPAADDGCGYDQQHRL